MAVYSDDWNLPMKDNQVENKTPSHKLIAGATLVGTTLEYFDFISYAIAAAVAFGAVFFPSEDPLVGTMFALGTFAGGFVARPLGAVIFGALGDTIGRKRTLIASFMLMGIASLLVGVLPTYGQIGVAAPILLTLLRILQGIGVGGEFAGSALFGVENAPENRRALWGSWTAMGTSVGPVLATGLFTYLLSFDREALLQWGWRVPFLLSGLLVIFGVLIRRHLEEPLEFQQHAKESVPQQRSKLAPLAKLFRQDWRGLIVGALSIVGFSTLVWVLVTFMNTYVETALHVDPSVLLGALTLAQIIGALSYPFVSMLADKIGLVPTMLFGNVAGAAFCGLLFFPLVNRETYLMMFIATTVAYGLTVFVSSPSPAFLRGLFRIENRYTGMGLSYQLGHLLGGGFAPLILTALFRTGNAWWPVALYLAGALAIAAVAVGVSPILTKQQLRRESESAKPVVSI